MHLSSYLVVSIVVLFSALTAHAHDVEGRAALPRTLDLGEDASGSCEWQANTESDRMRLISTDKIQRRKSEQQTSYIICVKPKR